LLRKLPKEKERKTSITPTLGITGLLLPQIIMKGKFRLSLKYCREMKVRKSN